jgi:hypothetical protein
VATQPAERRVVILIYQIEQMKDAIVKEWHTVGGE